MSTMTKTTTPRRLRRQFDDEFKAGAVRLVLDEGQTVGRVARDLDLTESALRNWVDRARADRTKGPLGVDDRGARGTAAAPQGESTVAGGARRVKKSRGGFNLSMQQSRPVYQQA